MSNIAGIYPNDTTAGTGISVSVYFSGCNFHCKGCHNQQLWDFNYGEPFTDETIAQILDMLEDRGIVRSLSILGGEPLDPKNIYDVEKLVNAVRANEDTEHTLIYLWTGSTLEELQSRPEISNILKQIDVAIVGPFVKSERDITLPLRGSRNQQIIHFFQGEPYVEPEDARKIALSFGSNADTLHRSNIPHKEASQILNLSLESERLKK